MTDQPITQSTATLGTTETVGGADETLANYAEQRQPQGLADGHYAEMAQQQRNNEAESNTGVAKKRKRNRSKKNKFVAMNGHDLYFSGVPSTITKEELIQFFSKAGIIKKEANGEPRIKLYHNSDNSIKGDGIVSYLRPESIQLAMTLLDEAEIIPGSCVKVEEAHYTQKENFTAPKREKKVFSKQLNDLSWNDDERTHVVVKHLFTLDEMNISFKEELREDLLTEFSKCGEVKMIKIFERNPEGVAAVVFKTHEGAEKCIAKNNGRFFAQKKLSVEYYDGYSNYDVEETEAEREERIRKWHEELDNQTDSDDEENDKN